MWLAQHHLVQVKDLEPNLVITLRRVRNPSAPSTEEVWQSLRDYRVGIPERLARWKQAEQASQESLAQVEQHEPSSRDTLDVLFYLASQLRPPQVLSDHVSGARDPRVTHDWGVVVLTNNKLALGGSCRDDFAIVLPPLPLNFNKVVSVHPGFEGTFVLRWKCRKSSDEYLFGKDDDVFVIALSLIVISSPR